MGLFGVLAGCVGPGVEVPQYRDRAAPIGSTLRGAPQDIAGEWRIAAGYPGVLGLMPGQSLVLQVADNGRDLMLLVDGRRLVLNADGPSRYLIGNQALWVLWLDDGFRTAVIGAPDGLIGWIMHRPRQASADRMLAAREILDFNGYDLTALVVAP